MTFKSKEVEHFFRDGSSTYLPHSIQRTALRKIWFLNAAKTIHDLRTPPGNHLWNNGHAFDVDIIDYHK